MRPSRRWQAAAVSLTALVGACTTPARRAEPSPGATAPSGTPETALLRVCADPNNMPYSNERGDGFENRLAGMVAADLGRTVQYTWWAQRRGFIRNTLDAGACDVVMGVPARYELTRTTRPYYRSTYVYLTRAAEPVTLESFDDPLLRTLRIGVHVVGDDSATVPPAQALASRGVVENIRGYSLFGDYTRPDPPADLIAALAKREIDLAFAWGPLAGYFAPRQPIELVVTPVPPDTGRGISFAFDISMGVRHADEALAEALNGFIERRRVAIEQLLAEYGVPQTPLDP